jgi:hypothetical protein
MPKRSRAGLRIGIGLVGLVSLLTLPLDAQETATLALTNGERPSGDLLDLNGSGFWLRVNGQDRAFPLAQVSVVEFVVGPVSGDAQAKINAGLSFVILRSGQLVDGRLNDIGGTRPLKITIDTPGGPRDFTSSDVAQIYVNPMARSASRETPQAQPGSLAPGTPGAIAVPANVAWTETGITISSGQRVVFAATGDIMISSSASSGPGGSPAATVSNLKYPVAAAPVGALIGRVGNGAPFLIGANTQPMQIPGRGRLMLGVNDDHVPDNSGTFYVTVSRAP